MISMAIKYVVLPEKKMVIAILKNTKFDAYNKAMKLCRELSEGQTSVYICPDPNKMMMPNEFKGVAVCSENDIFDEEIGKEIAKRICLGKYYRSFDKRINNFRDGLDIIRARYYILENTTQY